MKCKVYNHLSLLLPAAICFFLLTISLRPVQASARAQDSERNVVVSSAIQAGEEAAPESSQDVFIAPPPNPLQPDQYRKDRIFIRFKEGTGLSAVAPHLIREKIKFQKVTGKAGLDALNAAYGVKEIKPLIKGDSYLSRRSSLGPMSGRVAKSLENQKKNEIVSAMETMNARYPERSQHANVLKQSELAAKLSNTFVMVFDEEKVSVEEVKAAYAKDPHVEKVELIGQVFVSDEPADPYYASYGSWGQEFLDMYGLHPDFLHVGDPSVGEGAWANNKGVNANNVATIVAVIDTGVDYLHEDIALNMWKDADGHYGYDFVNNDSDPMDDHGHGTHCAGTIAAVENTIGIIGVAPKAKIMSVKGLDANGFGYDDDLAEAIEYAVDNGASILSNSWGKAGYSSVIEDAFKLAHASGCVSVAAAGNSNADANYFTPAGLPSVITVAAINKDHDRASFSNFGSKIDVAAPGVDVLSLKAAGMCGIARTVNTDYCYASGTSMACPHVAGVLALMKAYHPEFTNEELRSALRRSATNLGPSGFDTSFGYGLVNADAALEVDSPLAAKIFSAMPDENQVINVRGVAYGASFSSYNLEYAQSLSGNWIPADDVMATEPQHEQVVLGPEGPEATYPVLGTFSTSGLQGIAYVKLTVLDQNNHPYQDFFSVIVVNGQKPGWPIAAYDSEQGMEPSSIVSSPMVANIDNSSDGSSEVIINTVSGLFIFNKDGEVLSGWPKNYDWPYGSGGFSTPAVVDLDADGDMEIISMGYDGPSRAGVRTIIGTSEPIAGLHIWHHDGSIYNASWPQPLTPYLPGAEVLTYLSYASPAVGDIDKDGEQEIVVAVRYGVGSLGFTSCALFAFEQDGSLVHDGQGNTQWPRLLSANNVSVGQLLECQQTPLLVDLNKDGRLEIVQGVSFSEYKINPPVNVKYAQIDAFDAYGNIPSQTQWPWVSATSTLRKNLVAGDINGDGEAEIIAQVTGQASLTKIISPAGSEIVTSSLGSLLPANCSLADIDEDGKPEIIFMSYSNKLWVCKFVNNQLVSLPGWPKVFQEKLVLNNVFPTAGPSIADVNGDGHADIIVVAMGATVTPYSSLKAFDRYGNLIAGWPKYVQPADLVYSQPTVADIDGDGKTEVLIGNYFGQVLAYGLEQNFNSDTQKWSMYQHDLRHAGFGGEPIVPKNQAPVANAGGSYSGQADISESAMITLDGSQSVDPDGYPNPLTYQWTWDGGSATGVNPTVNMVQTVTSVTLTVSDGETSVSDTAAVTIAAYVNQAPIANAGEDQSVYAWYPALLDATQSSDSDGPDPLTYMWQQISGPIQVSLVPTGDGVVSFEAPTVDAATTLTFKVIVSDGLAVSEDTVDVVVQPNTLPQRVKANVTLFNPPVFEGDQVSLDLTQNIIDPETSSQLVYSWKQIYGIPVTDGQLQNGPMMTFVAPSVSSMNMLIFRVYVNDGSKCVLYHVLVKVFNRD